MGVISRRHSSESPSSPAVMRTWKGSSCQSSFSGHGDLSDPQLRPSAPAQISFQVGYESCFNEASTASPPMERPRVRGSDHQLDMWALSPILSSPAGTGRHETLGLVPAQH